MEFDGEIIKFNIYDSMKYPNDDHSVFSVHIIDSVTQQIFELNDDDPLKVAFNNKSLQAVAKELELSSEL